MKLCITGGGTGGHLMIAQSLLESAHAKGNEVIFIASTSGHDKNYFENESKFSHVYFLHTTGVVNITGLGKLKAIYKILNDNIAVSSMVGTRIAPNVMKQTSAFPFIVYDVSSDTPEGQKDSVALLDTANIMVSAYCKTY
mgnify:CR=1 FL=1